LNAARLSLSPPSTFDPMAAAAPLISDAEIAYIAGGILDGVRSDGRGCYDVRPVEVELDVVAQAAGSARVHLGATDVLVAVRVSP